MTQIDAVRFRRVECSVLGTFLDYLRPHRSLMRDGDSMLLTRTEFNREIARERIRASRRGLPFCILTIELLEQKQLALRQRSLARILHRNLRITDHKATLGRTRFGILLVDTPELGGHVVLERMKLLCDSSRLTVRLSLDVHDPAGFEHGDDDQFPTQGNDRRQGDNADASWYRLDRAETQAIPIVATEIDSLVPIGSAVGVCSDDAQTPAPFEVNAQTMSRQATSKTGHVVMVEPVTTEGRKRQGHTTVVSDNAVFDPESLGTSRFQRSLKRMTDLVGATLGLALTSPVILISMIAIRLTSDGPALFLQTREGAGGKPFTIYKLRTMEIDAERRQSDLRRQSHRDGPAFKVEDDPRVIAVGHFLRRTCIDELPQFINVIKGDMSLVGPRPLPWHESRACERWQRRRLDVLPGMTCYWQVDKAAAESFDDWMRMDLQYVDRNNFWEDLRLIIRTVLVPITGRGSE